MIPEKYRSRKGYEDLLMQLAKYSSKLNVRPDAMSDYELLRTINFRLIELKCTPFITEELEMELV